MRFDVHPTTMKSYPRVKTRGLQNGPIGAIIPAAPKGAQ